MQQKKGTAASKQSNKKFELTEEQKQEIREAFDLFDTDGSGMYFPIKIVVKLSNYVIVLKFNQELLMRKN